jgi:proline racemase
MASQNLTGIKDSTHSKSGVTSPPPLPSIFPANFTWQPPSSCQKITTIDTHTGGEPLRIIISGLPPIHGRSVLEKRRYFMEHYDHLRTGLLLEPRGHADMYGAILTESEEKGVDFDCFFINTNGYSPMCGHAILAIAKVVLETRLVKKEQEEVNIAVPAGIVHAHAVVGENGEVKKSSFKNVPSFVYLLNQYVAVPGTEGGVKFDVAFGGAFYAFVDADVLKLDLTPENYRTLIDSGRRIKKAIVESVTFEHPFESDLSGLFGVIFIGKAHDPAHHSRNVNIFEDGDVDRSSTGTGVSARAALHFAKGELAMNESIEIESIIGSTMTVSVIEEVMFGNYKAVVPEVGGEAYITGRHELYFYPEDPFSKGFMLR